MTASLVLQSFRMVFEHSLNRYWRQRFNEQGIGWMLKLSTLPANVSNLLNNFCLSIYYMLLMLKLWLMKNLSWNALRHFFTFKCFLSFRFNYKQLNFCRKLVTFLCLQGTFQYGNTYEFKNGIALFSMLGMGKGLTKYKPHSVSHSASKVVADTE